MKNLPDPELLSAYLDGELTADQQAHVERLLAASAEARQLLEDLRTVGQSLQSLPVYKLAEDLTPRILQEAQRRKQSALPASTAPTLGPSTAPQAASEAAPRPTDGWQAPDAAVGKDRPGLGWNTLFRRLLNSRGIVWSATAVAVAVLLWWFGPAVRPRIPEVAQAPKAPDHLEKKADSEGRSLEDAPNGWAGDVRRRAPTGATIGPRPVEALSPEAMEAEKKATASSELLAAAKEPSVDRTPSSAPELPSRGFGGGVPQAPPLAPAMAQPPLEEKTSEPQGKRALGASPSPSAHDEAGKGLVMGRGVGASMAGPEAPALGSRGPGGRPSGDGAAGLNAMGELRASGASDALPAPGGVGRPSVGGGAASAEQKQVAESESNRVLRKALPPAPAAKPTGPPSEGYGPPASAMAKKEAAFSAAQEASEKEAAADAPAIPDTTMVVVCDLSAPALRQRSFEQILSSQQIALQEGEEVLEELAALGREGDRDKESSASSAPEIARAGERNDGGPKAVQAVPAPVPAGAPSQPPQREKKLAKTQASADQRAEGLARTGQLPAQGGGFSRGGTENQLQFVLVEASPEQLEGTLKAMQSRPEEFLSVSVSPAPAEPAQQMYQQYARAYRARSSFAGQTPVGQLPSAGRPQFAAERNAWPSDKAPPPQASRGPESAWPQAASESTKGKTLQESAPSKEAEQAFPAKPAMGRQDQQMFSQQARARRLRLPEHLSQQYAFSQQQAGQSLEQLRRQAPADAQTLPSPAAPSAEPDRSQPPMAPEPAPAKMDSAKEERKPRAPEGLSPSGPSNQSGTARFPQTQQLIRVLFVLRPAEAAP